MAAPPRAALRRQATSCIKITHHFLNKILEKEGQTGFIGFTSSSAGFVPNPLSAMYASTKAFLTMFATSLAPEVRRPRLRPRHRRPAAARGGRAGLRARARGVAMPAASLRPC